MTFVDSSRPVQMRDADTLFQRLSLRFGGDSGDVNDFMAVVGANILSAKTYELDQFWSNLERTLVGRDNRLQVQAGTDDGKLQVALSLFYPAINHIDKVAVSTGELAELRSSFEAAAKRVIGRFAPNASAKDKRVYERIVDTIDQRMADVVERFNTRVEAGEIRGPQLS